MGESWQIWSQNHSDVQAPEPLSSNMWYIVTCLVWYQSRCKITSFINKPLPCSSWSMVRGFEPHQGHWWCQEGHPTTIAPVLQWQKQSQDPLAGFLTGYGDFKRMWVLSINLYTYIHVSIALFYTFTPYVYPQLKQLTQPHLLISFQWFLNCQVFDCSLNDRSHIINVCCSEQRNDSFENNSVAASTYVEFFIWAFWVLRVWINIVKLSNCGKRWQTRC